MTGYALPIDASSGSPSYTAQQTRMALSVLAGVAPAGRPLGAISGARAGTPSTTVTCTGTGSMTWNCAAFSAVLDVEASASAGPYNVAFDGTDTGTITAQDPANPRVDILYIQLNDTVQDSSGLRGCSLNYLAGTAAGSPSPPSPPNSRTLVIANINVPKNGTGAPTATWVAPVAGGPQGTDITFVLGGLRFSFGSVNVSLAASNTGSASITFPVAYSSAPKVYPTMTTQPYIPYSSATTTSGSTINVGHRDNAGSATVTLSVNWFAIGPA